MRRFVYPLAVVTALTVAACTSPSHPATAPAPSTTTTLDLPGPGPTRTAPTLCNGRGGEALVRGLFADLSAGRRIKVTTYFSPPENFVRWVDPTDPQREITLLPGPVSETTYSQDPLQSRLDKLSGAGLGLTLTSFSDLGYQGPGGDINAGGWFDFNIVGGLRRSSADAEGAGKGAVDCASGKLKVLVIDDW